MNRVPVLALAGAAALGAATTYAFDPSLGRQRRHVLKDRAASAARRVRHFGDKAARDLRNRAQGAQAKAGRAAHEGADVNDRILAERVRAKLGRYVSHPKAIAVLAKGGSVHISGAVLEDEYATAIKAAGAVRGVKALEDRLVVHRSAIGVPSLQGGKRPVGEPTQLERRNWAPAVRFAGASIAMALLSYAAMGGGRRRVLAAIVAALLLLRTVANRPLLELLDRHSGPREVTLAPLPEAGAWNFEES